MSQSLGGGGMLLVAVAVGLAVAAGAAAHGNDPMPAAAAPAAKAAYARHENFEQIGKTFKTLNDELRKGAPNRAVVSAQTANLQRLAKALPTWFPRGSGVEARPKSEAKANIWTDAAGFAAASSAFQAQTAKLNQVALSGDFAAVRAEVRPTGGTCKACHDKYRLEKK
jgi:cytochrome c556